MFLFFIQRKGTFIASQSRYDLFLTHIGSGIRRGFITGTFEAAKRVGDELLPSLVRAIEGSQISLIIFSIHFAPFQYCLEQLVKKFAFTDVNFRDRYHLSWVRIEGEVYHFGIFRRAIGSSRKKMPKWRKSLAAAADLYGLHSSDFGYDDELIDEIVKHVLLQRLNQPCQGNSDESPLHFDVGQGSQVFYSGSSASDDDDDSDIDGGETETVSSGVVDESNIHNVSSKGAFTRTITPWRKGEILGRGSCGSVYEGFGNDGSFFAVKEVCLKDEGSHAKQLIFQLEQEILLLSRCQHENIVRYLDTDTDNNMLYIFLELVTKGSLERLYKKYTLTDSQVSGYTRQILSGLKYLHGRCVIHRDIKCANILLHENGTIKLADFGLAKETRLNDAKTIIGTAFWMAPEVVRGRSYGQAADIWSLGCTTLEMLTRKRPYFPLERCQAIYKIGRGKSPTIPNFLSRDARDFISKCLRVNPSERPTAAQLLDHPFVKRPSLSPTGHVSPQNNLELS